MLSHSIGTPSAVSRRLTPRRRDRLGFGTQVVSWIFELLGLAVGVLPNHVVICFCRLRVVDFCVAVPDG